MIRWKLLASVYIVKVYNLIRPLWNKYNKYEACEKNCDSHNETIFINYVKEVIYLYLYVVRCSDFKFFVLIEQWNSSAPYCVSARG